METFKHQHKIEVMLSTMLEGKAPPEWRGPEWAAFHHSFTRRTVTPYELAGAIWKGYAFTPVFDGRRKEEHFVAAWHMAFDFDDEGAHLDFLMRKDTFAWMFANFAYATPSSTAAQPKSRVVFIFDEPIADPARFREIYRAIAWRFAQEGSYTDPACKDPLRLYFGSPRCEMRGNWSMLTDSTAQVLIDQYAAANPPKVETRQPVPAEAVSDKIIDYRIQKALDNLRHAAPGQRHITRRNMSRLIGGFVGAGYIDRIAAERMAVDAAMSSTNDPETARADIIAGIDYGINDPVHITVYQADDIGALLS